MIKLRQLYIVEDRRLNILYFVAKYVVIINGYFLGFHALNVG